MIRNTMRRTATCVISLSALQAFAADVLPGDINPGIALRRQADIRLDKELAVISRQRIVVEDAFTGTGKQKQFVPVVFTLPPMRVQDDDAQHRIHDLRFAVNGMAIKPARKLTVMLGDKDIAWRIATLGWKESELIAFLRDGQAPAGKLPLPAAWFDTQGRPRFQLRETYSWDQWFAPGRAVTIRHSYAPATSGETGIKPSQLIRRVGDAACIDEGRQSVMKSLDAGAGIDWTGVRYRIAGSRGWRPGAQDFTLRVDTGGDFLATCMTGGKALDKRVQQFRAGNISMDQVIDLVFARTGRQSP
ncbi:MAG: DUF4424 family protein [Xanthomonadales bacterium]|nr:DUF4424 family protein [Xanthomonadales bacterium]